MGLIERTISLRRKEKEDAKSPSYTPILRQHAFESPQQIPGHKRRQSESLLAQHQKQGQEESSTRPATSGEGLRHDHDAGSKHPPLKSKFQIDQHRQDTRFPSPRPYPGRSDRSATHDGGSTRDISRENVDSVGAALDPSSAGPQERRPLGRSYTAGPSFNSMSRQSPPSRPAPTLSNPYVEDASRPQAKRQRSWKTFFHRKPSRKAVGQTEAGQILSTFGKLPDDRSPIQSPVEVSPGNPLVHRNLVRMEARAEADHWTFHAGERHNPHQTPSIGAASKTLPSPHNLSQPRSSLDLFSAVEAGREKDLPTPPPQKTVWRSPSTPHLNVDIPDHEMERYSVMFGKLLQPRQSILDRRRTKLEQLNANPKADPKEANKQLPLRTLTSPGMRTPQPARLETFDPRRGATVGSNDRQRSPGLHRSNTAPMKSPVRMDSGIHMSPTCNLNKALPLLQHSPAIDEESLPPTPMTCDDVDSIFAAAQTASSPPPIVIDNKQEQQTNITTSNKPLLLRSVYQTPAPAPAPAAPEESPHQLRLSPKVRSPQELEKRMVQVSVARQVSVSKARRQVRHAVENQQRIQSLRPTVIEVSKDCPLRQSTVVVIEEA